MISPMAGVELDIRRVEQQLGVTFPDDYREWLSSANGVEAWFGDVFVMLYSIDNLAAVTLAAEADERLPGFVAFGSDGGGETLAFDFRKSPPPVIMVNAVCSGWEEGLFQAPSFSEFMAQRDAAQPLRWDVRYG